MAPGLLVTDNPIAPPTVVTASHSPQGARVYHRAVPGRIKTRDHTAAPCSYSVICQTLQDDVSPRQLTECTPLEVSACLKVGQETVSLLEPPSHTMDPDHLPAVAPTTPLTNPLARLENPRTLITLGTSVLIWLILFALSWCLLSQSALIWLLGQTVLPGRFAVWLAQSGLFGLGQVLPPALTLALCRQQGAKGVLPLGLLTVALVPFALTFGRIDTQGTIWQNFDRAVQQDNMKQARGLLLILTRRYAEYGYFTDGAALIRAGVDPNVQDSRGVTPLMSVLDSPPYVQQLVQQGADLQLKDGNGKTAMDYARSDAKVPQTLQILQQAQQRQQTR